MMNLTINYYPSWGYISALFSAFLWALAAILYKNIGKRITPIGMNIGKGFVAVFCIGALLLVKGFEPISDRALFFLAISGILGISFGDTFFFIALSRLKSSTAVLMTTLIPVITVLFAFFFLNERPSAKCWIGIILTISGIAAALTKQHLELKIENLSKEGIIYSLITAICCAASIIFSKLALSSVSALQASFVRNLIGLIALTFLGIISSNLKLWLEPLLVDTSLMRRLISIAFFGTFLGTWFSLLGLKLAVASVATVLNSTSPLFVIPLSFMILKQKISTSEMIGSVIAVVGVWIIFT